MAEQPRYLDIADKIRKRIEDGEWPPGARLPILDDFADEYGVNRNTVNRAINELEVDGYVWAVQGRGTTVRYGAIRPRRLRGDTVKRNAQTLGYSFPSASGQELWVRHGEADNSPRPLNNPRLAKYLGVPPGTIVPCRFRATGPVGEDPFHVGTAWIHPRFADIIAAVDANPAAGEWLYRIETSGHWPIEWTEFHRVRMPTKQEADLLKIPTSLPALEIVRVGYSGTDGKPVEVSEFIIAGDRVETVHVLKRDEAAQQPWPESNTDDPAGEA